MCKRSRARLEAGRIFCSDLVGRPLFLQHPDFTLTNFVLFSLHIRMEPWILVRRNLKDREASDWVGAIRDAYEVHESGTPQYRLGLWKSLFRTPTFLKSFNLLPPDGLPVQQGSTGIKNVDDSIDASVPTLTVCTRVPMTLEGLFDRILSKSYITALDTQSQQILRAKLQSVWNDHVIRDSASGWIDEQTVMFPYVTHVYIMQKN